jgi:hypothetical protein
VKGTEKMAKAIIKVDVRNRSSLHETLKAQHELRRSLGERAFSYCIDNKKRNIGYVILEWESLHSLHRFLGSHQAKEMMSKWPIEEIFDVLELYDITENILADSPQR